MAKERGECGETARCFQWAFEKIDRAAYWPWALKNFSGALCIDEIHDCGRTILVATDPVNDFTVTFLVVPKNNQRNMNRFLDLLKRRDFNVRVAVTDGSFRCSRDSVRPPHFAGVLARDGGRIRV